MKLQAIKKSDGKIWIAHGDAERAMEDGDELIELPVDWEQPNSKYRDCWREKDGEIIIDLSLARAQKLEEIRTERNKRLEESDKEWMVAVSMGIDPVAINGKKQALRDLPDAAETALAAKRSINTIDSFTPSWP